MKKKVFIPISVLVGALLLALVAAMTPFVAEPDVAYAQTPGDATLSDLTVLGQPPTTIAPPTGDITYSALSPTFDNDAADGLITEYEVRIPFVQTGVLVTPTAEETDQDDTADKIIRVNGTVVTSGEGHEVSLANRAGRTTDIRIVVQSSNRSNTETYTVKVYRERQARSDNNNLRSLSLSGVRLSPAFSASTIAYTARVQASEVTVSYALSDTGGAASAEITLPSGVGEDRKVALPETAVDADAGEGVTPITVTVTAEDGTTKAYNIEVYRIRDNPSINATLEGLVLTPTSSDDTADPAFKSDGNIALANDDFDARVNNDTEMVTVAATPDDAGAIYVIRPRDADGATPSVHDVALRAGDTTTITVTVTAEDPAATKTYVVKVYRERATPSDDNSLSALSLDTGTLFPAFGRSRTAYTVRVAPDVEVVNVTATPSDNKGGATVAIVVGGTDVGSEVMLGVAGATTIIMVTVTAEDESAGTPYTITVYRLRSLPSADASLSNITLDPAPTIGAYTFDTATKTYNVTVVEGTSTITVTPTANTGATYNIMPADSDDDTLAHEVALAAGMTTPITVMVTAEDGTSTDTYTINVYRQREDLSDDATLSALSLSDGMLSPAFMADRLEYKARVGSDVDKVTVSYTPTDNAGGVSVAVANVEEPVAEDAVCPTDDGDEVTLNSAGSETIISVCVTPEAGAGTANADLKRYMITVYRENLNLNTDATLLEFEIMDDNPAGDGAETWPLREDNRVNVDYRVAPF